MATRYAIMRFSVRGRIRASVTSYKTLRPKEFYELLDRLTKTSRDGSAGERLDRLIRCPSRSQDLAQEWIERELCKNAAKGQTLGPGLVVRVSKRLSAESILHEQFGVSVNLVRAGCTYEKAKAEYASKHGGVVPSHMKPIIWDEAIMDRMRRTLETHDTVRWLPLHDGTTSNPKSNKKSSVGGLKEWEALVGGEVTLDMTELPEDREWTPRAKEETEPFQVDKEWLAEHHISTAELAALGRTTLTDLGVDASAVDALLDGPDGLSERAGKFNLILRNPRLARMLDEREDADLSAERVLSGLGMPVAFALTGFQAEEMMADMPDVNPVQAWRLSAEYAGAPELGDVLGYHEYLRHVAQVSERITAPCPQKRRRHRPTPVRA